MCRFLGWEEFRFITSLYLNAAIVSTPNTFREISSPVLLLILVFGSTLR